MRGLFLSVCRTRFLMIEFVNTVCDRASNGAVRGNTIRFLIMMIELVEFKMTQSSYRYLLADERN